MSAVAIILLVIPIMIALGALIYLLNKLLPGGLIGSFTSDEDTLIAVTGDKSDTDAQAYKLKQKKNYPGFFTLVNAEPGTADKVEDDATTAATTTTTNSADTTSAADTTAAAAAAAITTVAPVTTTAAADAAAITTVDPVTTTTVDPVTTTDGPETVIDVGDAAEDLVSSLTGDSIK